ncbi:ATP-binding protein [Nocardiopsis trehalosi]|jgi:anti-sigma regulatory factor (Ser/Thr protein kinase)|uniref:ATP-binding protein n=1 Tax=Nocardiopsis trehalosi TaxID=109329 RepID=UPI00147168DD|nr:ATP-binding protein [Nocardiopsis trehalosi]
MTAQRHFRRTFDAVPANVAEARAWLTSILDVLPDVPDGMAEAAVLAVSEAATNVFAHDAGPTFTLDVTTGPWWIYVQCEDSGAADTMPHIVDASPTAEGGRGLRLIQAVTNLWGPLIDVDRCGIFFYLDWHPHGPLPTRPLHLTVP